MHTIRRSVDPSAWVFTKVDLTSGFYQIGLDAKDSNLTTLILPFGRYRYTVMQIGLPPVGDEFNRPMDKAVHGLLGIKI